MHLHLLVSHLFHKIHMLLYLFLLNHFLYILHLKGVWTREERALDPMLPLLVLSTFALALLMGFGFVKFLL